MVKWLTNIFVVRVSRSCKVPLFFFILLFLYSNVHDSVCVH